MKAANLRHVKILKEMIDSFFPKAYNHFCVTLSTTSKKSGVEKEGLTIACDLTDSDLAQEYKDSNGTIHHMNVLDEPDCSKILKNYLEEQYKKEFHGEKIISYLNVNWSFGLEQKPKAKQVMGLTIDFKFA